VTPERARPSFGLTVEPANLDTYDTQYRARYLDTPLDALGVPAPPEATFTHAGRMAVGLSAGLGVVEPPFGRVSTPH